MWLHDGFGGAKHLISLSSVTSRKKGRALSSHFYIYSFYFFNQEVSSGRLLTSHWSVLGHMTLAVGESGRASPPGNYGPFGEFVPTIRQEREE